MSIICTNKRGREIPINTEIYNPYYIEKRLLSCGGLSMQIGNLCFISPRRFHYIISINHETFYHFFDKCKAEAFYSREKARLKKGFIQLGWGLKRIRPENRIKSYTVC